VADQRALPRWVEWAVFAALLLGGLAVRLFDVTDAPLDFHPTRQLHSAIITRAMYFDWAGSQVDPLEAGQAQAIALTIGQIEPQVMEALTARIWVWMGATPLWVGRVLTITFWMLGAVGIWLLSRKASGVAGGLVGLSVWLFLPYAVISSRSFQPDPLAVALSAWSMWAIWRWVERPTWKQAILAGVLGGLAVFIKTPVAALLVGGSIGLIRSIGGLRSAFKQPSFWLLVGLGALPYLIYFVDGMWVSGFLARQTAMRFFPQYWIDPAFYLRWLNLLADMVGWLVLVLAFSGIVMSPSRPVRAMLVGLWAGYVISGLVLSHHISTHDYYSLPVVILLALGISAVSGRVWQIIQGEGRWKAWVMLGVFALAVAYPAWQVRTDLKRTNYQDEVVFWETIGKRMGGAGTSVVALSEDYGARLKYWAWISPRNWPTADDSRLRASVGQEASFEELAQELTDGAQYFLVTMPDEFARQPELHAWLDHHFKLVESTDRYWLFDLTQPIVEPKN
jgi:hypothetical protein